MQEKNEWVYIYRYSWETEDINMEQDNVEEHHSIGFY